jgi:hypothetical protein
VKSPSPTLEGFRATFHRPALATAEIAWRWSFGTAMSLLLTLSFLEYLDTLPVTNADLFFLRTRHPVLISQAVSHILRGSALRFVLASAVLFATLAAGWILASSLGRAVTLRWLVDYFGARWREWAPRSELPLAAEGERWGFRSLAGLSVLRVSSTLAAVIACLGASVVAGFVSSSGNPRPALAFLLFIPMVCLVWLSWSALNWFFSLASIFVVRDGQDTFGAVSAAVGAFRAQMRPILAVSFWFGLAHLTAFSLATTVVAFPLSLAGVMPPGIPLVGVALVTLLYCAVVDWLYAARLAGYVAILEGPEVLPEPDGIPQFPPLPTILVASALEAPKIAAPQPLYPPIPPSDDDILSDVPLPPSETCT